MPHAHLLIATVENPLDESSQALLENMISGCVGNIVRDKEIPDLIRHGLIKDATDYFAMKENAERVLPHSCNSMRCLRRVGPNENDYECRVPDIHEKSPDPTCHMYVHDVIANPPNSAWDLYHSLGWAAPRDQTNIYDTFQSNDSMFQIWNHYPPSLRSTKKFSPCHRRLYLLCRGNNNLQITTRYHNKQYLVKYVAKTDEANQIWLVADGSNKVMAIEKTICNTKLSNSANLDKEVLRKKRQGAIVRRNISHMEIEHVLLGKPMTIDSERYIHISTMPLEFRVGYYKEKTIVNRLEEAHPQRPVIDTTADLLDTDIFGLSLRANMNNRNAWRKFRQNQVLVAKDFAFSNVSMDRVTLFGLRPPELVCLIPRVDLYFRWAYITSAPKTEAGQDTLKALFDENNFRLSVWTDCYGNSVKFRLKAIPEIKEWMSQNNDFHGQLKRQFTAYLHQMFEAATEYLADRTSVSDSFQSMLKYHVQDEELELPHVVFSQTPERNIETFLYHLLMSFGHFETELDFAQCTTTREAFRKAKLLQHNSDAELYDDVQQLTKRYLRQQLWHYPVSMQTFHYRAVTASKILQHALLHNEILQTDLPPCLYTACVEQSNEKCRQLKQDIKSDMAWAITYNLEASLGNLPGFPTKEDLQNACREHPLQFIPTYQRAQHQSQLSFDEHILSTTIIKETIHAYTEPTTTSVKNLILNGGPGKKKTGCSLKLNLHMLTPFFYRLYLANRRRQNPRLAIFWISSNVQRPVLYQYCFTIR